MNKRQRKKNMRRRDWTRSISALDEKIDKLKAFMETERFCALDEAEQERMDRQLAAMQEYSGILADRIAAF